MLPWVHFRSVLLVGVAGCASARATGPTAGPHADAPLVAARVPSAPAPPTADPTSSARRVALHFELNGHKFPLPLVHGVISGVPVWMLVDTGANSHVIARWVARKAGLRMRALGDVGSDHTWRAVAAYSVEHPKVGTD